MTAITDEMVQAALWSRVPRHHGHAVHRWELSPSGEVVNVWCACDEGKWSAWLSCVHVADESVIADRSDARAMKRCPCGANAVDGMSHCSVGCMQRDTWWQSQHQDVRPCGCHGSGLCSRCAREPIAPLIPLPAPVDDLERRILRYGSPTVTYPTVIAPVDEPPPGSITCAQHGMQQGPWPRTNAGESWCPKCALKPTVSAVAAALAFKFQRGPRITTGED